MVFVLCFDFQGVFSCSIKLRINFRFSGAQYFGRPIFVWKLKTISFQFNISANLKYNVRPLRSILHLKCQKGTNNLQPLLQIVGLHLLSLDFFVNYLLVLYLSPPQDGAVHAQALLLQCTFNVAYYNLICNLPMKEQFY